MEGIQNSPAPKQGKKMPKGVQGGNKDSKVMKGKGKMKGCK
jgi:hypothetical protein